MTSDVEALVVGISIASERNSVSQRSNPNISDRRTALPRSLIVVLTQKRETFRASLLNVKGCLPAGLQSDGQPAGRQASFVG